MIPVIYTGQVAVLSEGEVSVQVMNHDPALLRFLGAVYNGGTYFGCSAPYSLVLYLLIFAHLFGTESVRSHFETYGRSDFFNECVNGFLYDMKFKCVNFFKMKFHPSMAVFFTL